MMGQMVRDRPALAPRSQDVIENFDAESRRWERHYGSTGSMTPRLQAFATALSRRVPRSARVLDFGCGTGNLARELSRLGWQVTGADVSHGMIDHARRADPSLPWIKLAADSALPFDDASFPAVVASSVLEYATDLGGTLHELWRVVEPGGWLLATVPNLEHATRRRERLLMPLARTGWARAVARGTRWQGYLNYLRLSVNRLSPDDWHSMLCQAGFSAPAEFPGGDALALLAIQRPRQFDRSAA
jgi:ubiquinone/menaquinone biosynthesis C-methylase UbiE